MKSTKCSTKPNSSTPVLTLLEDYNKRTIDRSKIPYLRGYPDHESRINEALCLASLLRELICPHWTRHPDHPESKILPFDSSLLEPKAREGLGYIAGRIEDVLQECEQAIYGEDEVSK